MVVPLANFIGRKVETIRGKPTGACPQTGNDLVAPFAAPCLATVQTGGTRSIKTANATARRSRSRPCLPPTTTPCRASCSSEAARKTLETDNVSVTLGPPSGYVIRFTNGLTVYLSGDTGLHAEMKSVVGDYYKANLMVLNLGPSAVTSKDAAYIANELVQARLRDRLACQRGRHDRRQDPAGFAHRDVHVARERSARLSCPERQDDGIQWRREVPRRVLATRAQAQAIDGDRRQRISLGQANDGRRAARRSAWPHGPTGTCAP